MKSATSSRASSRSSASRSLNGTRAMPGRYGPKRSVNAASPFTDSEPSVSPWKACSTQTTRCALRRRTAELDRRLDRLGAARREERLPDRRRRAADELLGEQRRDRRDPHLRRVRRLALHRLDEPVAHARVRAADVEHPEPAEPVEVALAVRVVEIGALGARPVAVEPDRPQHADHLRVAYSACRSSASPARASRRSPSSPIGRSVLTSGRAASTPARSPACRGRGSRSGRPRP